MNFQPLLIELGVEELPTQSVSLLANALLEGITKGLNRREIAFDFNDTNALSTPRRLAVYINNVATQERERHTEILGPYITLGLDENGQPTRALQGFARKHGVDWTDLERMTDAKGERFVYRATRTGQRTIDALPKILNEAINSLPIPKPMRWGNYDYAFVRPLHWLVLLYGNTLIPAELLGCQSTRFTRGHRFMANRPIELTSADEYVSALENAYVLVDPQTRKQRILEQINTAADHIGGYARITEDNLEQVVNLVEWPCAITGRFESDYLKVPAEALIETMEVNQKFFPVLNQDNQLTEYFIGIANIESTNKNEVAKGYERVIRPRFADAKFFFDEDSKQGLEAMGAGLANVTYQAKLGSLADKVQRLTALAQTIAAMIGVNETEITCAALLSKNDLQSRLVNEFPKLQGIAGRHYALIAGESKTVANAIDEAWQPRFANDAIAASTAGQVLALADRLDTLAGGFAAGLKPTGSKDPFSLRRAALGLARTLIEAKLDLNLDVLLQQACQQVAFASLVEPTELRSFIIDRLQAYYTERGVLVTTFLAVAQVQPASLYDFDRRIHALSSALLHTPDAAALAAANKRIANILRKVQTVIPKEINTDLLHEAAEINLSQALHAAIEETRPALSQKEYADALSRLAQLRPAIDQFFDQVMVNTDDLEVRNNRLALLQKVYNAFQDIAAVEQLDT